MSAHVLKPGLLSTLQDRGRRGHAAIGVGRTGAMDVPAWRLANALVGNRGEEAALECTLLGPTLRFEHAAWVAITGAPIAARVDDTASPTGSLPPARRQRAAAGHMATGRRSYPAVRCGFDAAPVLGSRSSDLHAGLGYASGRPLQAGDSLPIGRTAADTAPTDRPRALPWRLNPQPWFDVLQAPLMLLSGSHEAQLDAASRQQLGTGTFRVGSASNRTASRLDGARLQLRAPQELISEATLPGTVQLRPPASRSC
ncbi:Carboxyltransferase domain-containing protein OS=Rhodanobacter lindaniclasticus OX=75310 GN=B1991_09275 PE=4 SV=1 [Rhodanobacter lindaniclasticus]